jgi:hypothetical protein
MTTTAAVARYLAKTAPTAAAVITGHLWLAVAAAAAPCVLACTTAVVLVLSVDRGNRVEAIKALPRVIAAISKTALTAQAAGYHGSAGRAGSHSKEDRPSP